MALARFGMLNLTAFWFAICLCGGSVDATGATGGDQYPAAGQPQVTGAQATAPSSAAAETLVLLLRQWNLPEGSNASDLLQFALGLQTGRDGQERKRASQAAVLYAAIAAANQTGLVSLDDAGMAAVALGRMYLVGEGDLEKDAHQARDLFERAADLGYPEAQVFTSQVPKHQPPLPHPARTQTPNTTTSRRP